MRAPRTTFRFLFASLLLPSCRGETSIEPPTPSLERMLEQPRADPYEASPDAAGQLRSDLLVPPAGTVTYRSFTASEARRSGQRGGAFVSEVPFPKSTSFIRKGQRNYSIFCSPCHGTKGDGATFVTRFMDPPPPSLHDERVRTLSVGRLFSNIKDAHEPSFRAQLSDEERWQVVSFVRALQLSRHLVLNRLKEHERKKLLPLIEGDSSP